MLVALQVTVEIKTPLGVAEALPAMAEGTQMPKLQLQVAEAKSSQSSRL
jgi:hypothetical protein